MMWEGLFVSKHSANGFGIGENESEDSVGVTMFQQFVKGFPQGIAEEAVVW